ncbi:MAG TPA: pirin family protein [Vicinamibacterales bacterium]
MNDPAVAAETCLSLGASDQKFEAHPSREVKLGSLSVLRALPVRGRRLVGPWCFLDRFGPLTFTAGNPIDVAPHPHMGLQTVTWLLEGEMVHDDSLQNESVLKSGGLNVMTSGDAIAHAERSPDRNSGRLNGIQLWTALPDQHRKRSASFQHVADVPVWELGEGLVRVFSGRCGAVVSPAEHFSNIIGADVQVHPGSRLTLPMEREYEHAVLLLDGDAALEGQSLDPGVLYYLGTQRTEMRLASREGSRTLLIGGQPFSETILMWWNFVARTTDEIRQARDDWEAHRRFGEVTKYNGPRLNAPELAKLAPPNPVS